MTILVHLAVHAVRAMSNAGKKPPAKAGQASGTAPGHAPRALQLDLREEPMQGARCLRLRAGRGEVWLILCEPREGAAGSHDAVIEAKKRAQGAAFLKAVSRWLDATVPRPSGPERALAPFALQWRPAENVGRVGERVALTFAWRGHRAEVFLDLREKPPTAQFVEIDSASRADLVAILTTVLRDGAPA